jgi:trimeric autotransporter adhesin
MNTLILQFKKVTPLCLIVLALLPNAGAVSPPPGGGYPGPNTAVGDSALLILTSGFHNTAVGWYSLASITDGNYCTGVGAGTLLSNTADENTATGAGALSSNTTGNENTANGTFALFSNTTGSRHTAVGSGALQNCVAPPDFEGNTAVGTEALRDDTTGNFNTAIGGSALKLNTTGVVNTAIGLDGLVSNTTGIQNTASGGNALFSNTEGNQNTADGVFALFSNTEGDQNTASGFNALNANITGNQNTAIGFQALTLSTGSGNTALGFNAGINVATASNVIAIGIAGADVSNSCYIGNIFGATGSGGEVAVSVSPDGKLSTIASSRRFKKEIKSMDKASEAILALKPVTFHYKSDTKGTPQFGLIAEEVAEMNPDLVGGDNNGEIYTVRYDAVNAMLLNEFLKEHRKVEQLEKQIEKLAVGLQKVSAQIELSKQAPQTVLNNH